MSVDIKENNKNERLNLDPQKWDDDELELKNDDDGFKACVIFVIWFVEWMAV